MGVAAFREGSFSFDVLPLTKQQSDAPEACQADQSINDPADDRTLSAKQPGYQIELKDAHKAPVQAADDRKDQCQCIHDVTSIHFLGYV